MARGASAGQARNGTVRRAQGPAAHRRPDETADRLRPEKPFAPAGRAVLSPAVPGRLADGRSPRSSPSGFRCRPAPIAFRTIPAGFADSPPRTIPEPPRRRTAAPPPSVDRPPALRRAFPAISGHDQAADGDRRPRGSAPGRRDRPPQPRRAAPNPLTYCRIERG